MARPSKWIGIESTGRRTSIALVAMLVIGALTLAMLSGAGVVGYRLIRAQEEKQLLELNRVLAEQASTALSLPLWNFDSTQIRKASESVMKTRDANAIVVRQPDSLGTVLSLRKGPDGRIAPVATLDATGQDWIGADIHFSGENIGHVDVQASSAQMEEHLARIRSGMIIIVLAVAAILSMSLYVLLWQIVLKPIHRLERFSGQVEDGDFRTIDIGETPFLGELESLRSSLIKMVSLLEVRYAELQSETMRLKESREHFRTLIDTIPDLIWLKDVDGVYLSCNRMFERLFGAAEAEIVGKTDRDFVGEELATFFRRNDLIAMENGGPTRNEEWVVFADDGTRALLETTKTPMFDVEGKVIGVLGIGRDITARRSAEEERRALDERLGNIQKLEALGVLVAGVAHNINNVLAAILATSSLREESASLSEDRESFRIISTTCKRGRDVVRTLMQFSRPTLANKVPIDLHSLINEVRILLGNSTLGRVRIVEDFESDPVWIEGDAGSISNSLMNLCINAIDAMPEGGTITLRTRTLPNQRVAIEVEDTGEGIPPDILARVTEPFFTTKDVGKGTGLGLSMTHGVLKAHGGELEIRCPTGGGTIVRAILPTIPAPETLGATGAETPSPSLRILVVDDEEDIRILVARMLKAGGHEVETADGALCAIQRLETAPLPDLVVMDQNMPGMDGSQALERIRSIHPRLPILISSGQLEIQEWNDFRKPLVGVLSKPFDLAELKAKVAELMAQLA